MNRELTEAASTRLTESAVSFTLSVNDFDFAAVVLIARARVDWRIAVLATRVRDMVYV